MMNRGLGSIMGYRGGGMPVARFQEGGLTQADRDRIILEYTQAVYAQPGITPQAAAAQIAAAMDQFDVSPEEYAGAFQRDTSIVTPEQRDIFGNVGIIQQNYEAVRPEGEYSAAARAAAAAAARAAAAAAAEEEAIRRIAGGYADQLFGALRSGDRDAALAALAGAQRDFPTYDAFAVAAANIPSAGLNQDLFRNISGGDDVVTADELRSYLTTTGTGTDTVIDTSTEGREELTGGATFTGAGNVRTDTAIPGVPGFTRQQASGFSFAPIRRGLGQLRGPAYMPGLLQGTEGFGGTGLSREQISAGMQPYAQAIEMGRDPQGAIRDYFTEQALPLGLSPAEIVAANPNLSLGATQQYYNQFAPQGVFSTAAPGRPVLPEDFVLQTGAYTTPVIPRNIEIPALEENVAAKPLAGATPPLGATDYTQNPIIGRTASGEAIYASTNPDHSPGRSGGVVRDNEIIKMAEGGEAMGKLSASEAGSKFDISEFIDEQGRLVGGYSRPIRDQFGVITGYDYRPYERDVVFNPRLAEAEARGMSDEEREAARRGLIVRQGMTGVDPYAGGLAGIVAREAMMRSRPQYYSYAKGGDVSATAQDLASRGRGGDTMLVHMAPHEVAGLNALARMEGTELTINPETGMPEALKLGKLFKKLAPFVPFIPGVGQFLAPAFGALGMGGFSPLLQKAITSGVIGGFTGPKGGFDLQRGLMQGITAYGLGSLQQNLGGPGAPGGPVNTTSVDPSMGGVNVTGDVTGVPGEIPSPSELGQFQGVGGEPGVSTNIYGTYSDTAGAIQTQPRVSIVPETTAPGSIGEPLSTGQALLTSGFGLASTVESDKLASAQMAAQRSREEEEDIYRRLFENTLGRVRTAKTGGLMKLAGGGMTYMEAGGTTGPTGTPRDVTGTGDGMSDSVPATIEGVQEARLADGEFVIPADVVADIGNGSSDAGSKKLYDMMDRVRMARHGTKEQPPEIKAERLMPA